MKFEIKCPKCNVVGIDIENSWLQTIILCSECDFKMTVCGLMSQEFELAETDYERNSLIEYFYNMD